MKYYSLLKTIKKASPEILEMPLVALGLNHGVRESLERNKEFKDGKVKYTFTTIRDLLSYGKHSLMGLLSVKKPPYAVLNENMYHIEEKLAKLGLRFEDTDFTIGDVRLKELKLEGEPKKLLCRIAGTKMETLDDIIIYGYNKIGKFLNYGDRPILNEIEKEIAKYGLKIEGSSYKLSQKNAFPLDDYVNYLPEEFVSDKLENAKPKVKKLVSKNVDFSSLSQEEILKLPLDRIYDKASKVVMILQDLGLETIEDLTNYSEKKLNNLLPNPSIVNLQNKLATLNLKMKDSKVQIVNGQVIRNMKNNIKCGLDIYKMPKAVNVNKLNPIQKEKFLQTKIVDFGFSEKMLENLLKSGNYKTINDLLVTPRDVLNKDVGQYTAQVLVKAFALYNLTLSVSASREKYFQYSKANCNKAFKDMSDGEKSELLSKPFEEIYFTKNAVDEILKVNKNAKCLNDIVNLSRQQFLDAGVSINSYVFIRKALNYYDLDFVGGINKKKLVKDLISNLKSVNSMTEQERADFMQNDISIFKLTDRRNKELKNAGINTINDLVGKNSKFLYEVAKVDVNTVQRIREGLAMCGLALAPSEKSNVKKLVWTKREISKEELLPENYNLLSAKPIENLGIRVCCVKKFKDKNINTIGDLLSLQRREVGKILKNNHQVLEIQSNLGSLGLELKKNRRTPYYQHRTKEVTQRTITDEDLKPENKDALLKKTIDSLGIKNIIIEKLNSKNIFTIEDMCKNNKTKIGHAVKHYKPYVKEMRQAMQSIGLSVGCMAEIKNGREAKYTERKIKEEDLKPENRKELLLKPVKDMGILECIASKLEKNNIITIQDLLNVKPTYLMKNIIKNSGYAFKLRRALSDLGLEYGRENNKKSTLNNDLGKKQENSYQNTEKIEADELSDDKNYLLEKPIEYLGLNLYTSNKLKRYNINTVGDVCKLTTVQLRKDILKGYLPQYDEIKTKLAQNGLKIKKAPMGPKKNHPKTSDTLIINTNKQVITSDKFNELLSISDNKQELLARPILDLDLREHSVEKLKNANVNTIGDLTNLTCTELHTNILNTYYVAYKEIVDKLDKLGLDLKKVYKTTKKNITKREKLEIFKQKDEQSKLASNVEELTLPESIQKAINDSGINTVNELVSYSFAELKKKNISNNQAITIARRLKDCGFTLKREYSVQKQDKENDLKKKPKIMGKEQEKLEFVTMDDVRLSTKNDNPETKLLKKVMSEDLVSKLDYHIDLKPEQIKIFDDIRLKMRERGMWALYDLDNIYFLKYSKEMEAVKELAREFFDYRFKSLIIDAKNEDMLNAGLRKIERETQLFETIVEQKQTHLYSAKESLNKKKIESTSQMRNKVFKVIEKYHHNERDFTSSKDKKYRNPYQQDFEEFDKF